jgi:deoxyribose-phosphate aldolase
MTTVPTDSPAPSQVCAFLEGLPPLDVREVEDLVTDLPAGLPSGRSRAEQLDTALRLTDLTTLEGTDTAEHVRALAAQATAPDPDDPGCPPVAALCVYSDLTGVAAEALRGSPVRVAAVAAAFPSGRAPLAVRLADVRAAVAAGADEIDLVLDRAAFLGGHEDHAYAQLLALREACGPARLKVILETAELAGLASVHRAAWLALLAGADMVKTSTGKLPGGGATPQDVLVMLRACRAYSAATGKVVGVKASGGIRTAADALRYLGLVDRAISPEWLTPERFRIGASSLVGDLVRERR